MRLNEFVIRNEQSLLDALSRIQDAKDRIDFRLGFILQKPEVIYDIEDDLHNIEVCQKALLNLLVSGQYSPMTFELQNIMRDREEYFKRKRNE